MEENGSSTIIRYVTLTIISSYLEAMVGVLDAALGNAQIRKADLVEDHRLYFQEK
jgi:hypothetical protein